MIVILTQVMLRTHLSFQNMLKPAKSVSYKVLLPALGTVLLTHTNLNLIRQAQRNATKCLNAQTGV